MSSYFDDYAARRRDEDARLAGLDDVVLQVTHLALTNRALASAILASDTQAERFLDVCRFLDDTVLGKIRAVATLPLADPFAGEEEVEEPAEWTGPRGAPCSGRTAKGSACRAKATLTLNGAPFCRQHYPFSPEYRQAEERRHMRLAE